ncbi:odorant receptor 88a [Bactrocera neohumeralis]|uniref:odorant receptor 88a n=1 Tax=Bactrocera neohumeralis TaxID=98809 RepID=UPI0021656AEC|nr:odorant receptor 88a [Bactrocera neohumeralis]
MAPQQEGFGAKSKLCAIDDLCAIEHPYQRYLGLKYVEFKRVNGRFVIPKSNILNFWLFLAVVDCTGNVIKTAIAINDRDVTKAQEVFAVFGMGLVMTMRGFMLGLNRGKILKMYNAIDRIFPRSEHLQQHMEVEKVHYYLKKRFFYLHTFLTVSVCGFIFMPFVKFMAFHGFKSDAPVSEEFHVNASWLPFGVKDKVSTYPYIYVYELFLATAASHMLVVWDQIFVILISQLCMYYEYLGKLLAEMNVQDTMDPTKADGVYKQLHDYIYIHQYLNNLAVELNDLFNFSILSSDAGIAISICFNVVLITEGKNNLQIINYTIPLFVEVWLIYDASKWGTMLETVTARINERIYEQQWYDSSVRFGKYTLMWIQSTNEPFRLTVFNMFYVNMKHFQDMMMLAYQLLTFLKAKG